MEFYQSINTVNNTTALLGLKDELAKIIRYIEIKVESIDERRSFNDERIREQKQLLKALLYASNLPEFPFIGEAMCHSVANQFVLSQKFLWANLQIKQAAFKHAMNENIKRAVIIMHTKGYKQKRIARNLDLSTSRVSQIIKKYKAELK